MGVYGATKRGLDMFTRALVKEVDGTGVTVGQVRPGILITEGWLREAACRSRERAEPAPDPEHPHRSRR
ncbi:SDR family NAD(P)-dependent oxidoreductase [Aeromicrobium sp. UC242_57]|uniref:SDR family NAD(P)-dependent oxidoreductase n=1 Tax=Aeromicrobium sp. UC242_57 TaxID=3374624 RepID=UPI0037906B7C